MSRILAMPWCHRCCRLHLRPKDRGVRAQPVYAADHARRPKAVGHPNPVTGSPRQSAGTARAAAPAHRSQTNRRRNDPGGRDPQARCARCDRRMESVRVRENRETMDVASAKQDRRLTLRATCGKSPFRVQLLAWGAGTAPSSTVLRRLSLITIAKIRARHTSS